MAKSRLQEALDAMGAGTPVRIAHHIFKIAKSTLHRKKDTHSDETPIRRLRWPPRMTLEKEGTITEVSMDFGVEGTPLKQPTV